MGNKVKKKIEFQMKIKMPVSFIISQDKTKIFKANESFPFWNGTAVLIYGN